MGSRRSGRILLATMLAVTIGSGGVAVAPADAHGFLDEHWSFPYVTSQQCLSIGAGQNHGDAYFSRIVRTDSYKGGCQGGPFVFAEAGRIAQRGWAYKAPRRGAPGVLCRQGGWQYAGPNTSWIEYRTYENLWPWCNYGWNASVLITHDVESALWNPWTQSAVYRQALPHPTTDHCHDPGYGSNCSV